MALSVEEFTQRVRAAEASRNVKPWGLGRRIASFAAAGMRYVSSGFARVDQAEYERRERICHSCHHWDRNRCDICGCFAVKLFLPGERCPIGKWVEVK